MVDAATEQRGDAKLLNNRNCRMRLCAEVSGPARRGASQPAPQLFNPLRIKTIPLTSLLLFLGGDSLPAHVHKLRN
ncbi:hypothetical protein EYF80_046022 [Liparis tanakae]|uniref:Uncharacterized protein n=1 Tax=Liparis tanakae TaxID=230148 RepID=A0A4Z2FS86_9TELE|nr:hypothetical protein EYF80_046022 [Liparis tanakae]